jgi:hypothetical protein
MTIYTIVAYRQNSHYSRRQCVMGSSASDFEMHFCDGFEEAVAIGAAYRVKDADRDEAYAEWDVHLLVDGMDEGAWWRTDPDYVQETTWDVFERLTKENGAAVLRERERLKEEADLAAKHERDRISAEAALVERRLTEERERAEMKRLVEKYGVDE